MPRYVALLHFVVKDASRKQQKTSLLLVLNPAMYRDDKQAGYKGLKALDYKVAL